MRWSLPWYQLTLRQQAQRPDHTVEEGMRPSFLRHAGQTASESRHPCPTPVPPCRRSVSASLSLGLDHVRGGRVHKGTPLSRHHSLAHRYHAEREHPSNGRLRLSSHHHHQHHHQHQRSHPHAAHHRGFLRATSAEAGGYGGRGGSSGLERGRAGSLGLREGVDGIAVAQVGVGSRGGLRPVPGCCCRGEGPGPRGGSTRAGGVAAPFYGCQLRSALKLSAPLCTVAGRSVRCARAPPLCVVLERRPCSAPPPRAAAA